MVFCLQYAENLRREVLDMIFLSGANSKRMMFPQVQSIAGGRGHQQGTKTGFCEAPVLDGWILGKLIIGQKKRAWISREKIRKNGS